MSDLPRGWQITGNKTGAGVGVACTQPASPGVSHVLTSIVAQIANSGGASYAPLVDVLFGAVVVWQGIVSADPVVAPATIEVGELSWNGSLVAPVNTLVTVEVTAVAAGIQEWLTIQGYDI